MDLWTSVWPLGFVGALFLALAVPLIRQSVPPNPWYGFRVAKTMRNREVWYESNAYGGWLMAWLGGLTVLFTALVATVPGMDADRATQWLVGFLVAGSLVMLALWYRHLGTLDEPAGAVAGSERYPVEAPPQKLFAMLFMCCGIVFIGISIPMVQRQVPPNGTYGFRTPETLSNPEIWYAANAYSGWMMIGAGAVIIVAAIGLALARRVTDRAYVPVMLAVMLISLFASLGLSLRYLATLA